MKVDNEKGRTRLVAPRNTVNTKQLYTFYILIFCKLQSKKYYFYETYM